MSSVFSALDLEEFRRRPYDFSRDGDLSPELLTTLLLYMVSDGNRRGYQALLDAFWDEARAHGLPLPKAQPISAPSFCSARPKITSLLLRHILNDLAKTVLPSTLSTRRLWHGRRVFAVDSTKVSLQRHVDLAEAFGVPEGAYCPQAMVSVLLDVCCHFPVDVEIGPGASDEREHLLFLLPNLERGDLLVLDRGFPAHDVLQALCRRGIDYLMRVPSSSTFRVVEDFVRSGRSEGVFTIDPPQQSPKEWIPLRVRIVRLSQPGGGESFFLTSLPRKDFQRTSLRELYHLRWEVEEFFKVLKGPYIGQGQFRSRSQEGVDQEITALMLFLGICVLCMNQAAPEDSDPRQLARKPAILAVAAYVTRLFMEEDPSRACQHLERLLARLRAARYKKRPGRKAPRRSFKPRSRWCASGRVGG